VNQPETPPGEGGTGEAGVDGGDACVPSAEICDGLDNDCDGRVDNGLPMLNCGVGECARQVASCVGGQTNTCVEGTPTAETCDNLDNDCNGMADDGLGQTTCGVGACLRTVDNCLQGSPQTCVAGQPRSETCNNIDDNCDGTVDEGLGMTTCGQGACARTVNNCDNGVSNQCVPGTPGTEICNGQDDNCDGAVDEGQGSSTCGVGACRRTVQNCMGGQTQTCTPGTATTEVCNGADDDCNGSTDEGLGNATCGVGGCARSVPACVNGVTQTCTPGQATAEICDGIDNNCDGRTDEGDPGGGATCSTGLPGVCGPGHRHCMGGTVQCVGDNGALPTEICNGMDDNCDGQVDEGNPGGGGACNTGRSGICAAGTLRCTTGSLACNQTNPMTTETCNGRDDDCNGVVDDGPATTTLTCGVGACANSVQSCVNGTTQTCTPRPMQTEICNNIDDNCNGVVDDPTATTLCTAPANVATTTCTVGSCGVGTCDPGYYNVDNAYANGCECQDDASSTNCAAPTNGGALNAGGSALLPSATTTGKIPLPSQSDYYIMTFSQNTDFMMHGTGAPTVTFAANGGAEFRFEMRTAGSCGATGILGCGTGSSSASGLTSWSFTDNCTSGGNNCSTRTTGWPSSVLIRVYRPAVGNSCSQYQLRVTR